MRGLKNNRSVKGYSVELDKVQGYDPSLEIIAVDFDGTLVNNRYPFIENPNMQLIAYIKEHRHSYTWILWTCREGQQLKNAVDYMRDEHGIVFDYINENVPWMIDKFGDSRKIYANRYIDDKGSNQI